MAVRRRVAAFVALLVPTLVGVGPCTLSEAPAARPSIVLVVADDLGWGDVGWHGGSVRTPRLDALAAEGRPLERFYVAPSCSPTRVGLLTGRWPIHTGLMHDVVRPWGPGIPRDEETLAELLAFEGYVHRAAIGKWHVGHSAEAFHPLRQGFTRFYGFYNAWVDHFDHANENVRDWHRDLAPLDERGAWAGDLLTAEAVAFVREHAAAHRDGEPFFLYLAYGAPHRPLQAPQRCLDRHPDLPAGDARSHAAMVSCLDEGIGAVLDALDDEGIADDTLVWFLSDNGAAHTVAGSNAPLAGGKNRVSEGGVRVPAVVRWPAGGLMGGEPIDAHTGYIDVLPTLHQAIRGAFPPAGDLDGHPMLEVWRGSEPEPQRTWHAFLALGGLVGTAEFHAVWKQGWKLVWLGGDPRDGQATPFVDLFRIADDPFETTDRSVEEPAVVADLLAEIVAFRTLQPADVPVPTPHAPPPGWEPPSLWRVPLDPFPPDPLEVLLAALRAKLAKTGAPAP